MPRPSRANANAPRASHYVGYADDDEDVTAIMAKFAAIERAEKEAASRCGGTLTEEELVRATGAHAPAANELDGGGGSVIIIIIRRVLYTGSHTTASAW